MGAERAPSKVSGGLAANTLAGVGLKTARIQTSIGASVTGTPIFSPPSAWWPSVRLPPQTFPSNAD